MGAGYYRGAAEERRCGEVCLPGGDQRGGVYELQPRLHVHTQPHLGCAPCCPQLHSTSLRNRRHVGRVRRLHHTPFGRGDRRVRGVLRLIHPTQAEEDEPAEAIEFAAPHERGVMAYQCLHLRDVLQTLLCELCGGREAHKCGEEPWGVAYIFQWIEAGKLDRRMRLLGGTYGGVAGEVALTVMARAVGQPSIDQLCAAGLRPLDHSPNA
mmetsp:Transcript_37379/g.112000  ORF Transcript_37379/g.112000 Transcript_37379/m.112000 type:complete len:210 (+) Transcript_37379:344-973(+)